MLKLLGMVGVFALTFASVLDAQGQASNDILSGRWQLEANSVFIEFSSDSSQNTGESSLSASSLANGSGTIATVVKDDWNLQRVGLVHLFDIVATGKKSWEAKIRIDPDSNPRPARIRMSSNSKISVKTTSGRRVTFKYKKVDEG